MKLRLTTYLLLLLMGIQLLSLPLSIGYFYANRAKIAATKCVNRLEPTILCSGKCYLQNIVIGHMGSLEKDKPLPPDTDRNLPILLLDSPPVANQIILRPSLSDDDELANNFDYLSAYGRRLIGGVFHPPRPFHS